MSSGQPDWMNVTLLKGIDSGGNLLTIAVDDSGHMISVMQGDYAGALKTLALDSQGRIQAVLTDPEDVFGNPNYMGAAELAVRLDSTVNFDRLGNVLWKDDFEGSNLNWTVSSTGGAGTAALDTAEVLNGLKSCKVVTPGGNQNNTAIQKGFAYPRSSQIGVEVSFMPDSDLLWIELRVYVYDGAEIYQAFFRVYTKETYVSLFVHDLNWVNLTPSNEVYIGGKSWHKMKMVIDYVDKTNVRVLYDNQVYDTSAYTLRHYVSGSNPHIWVEVVCVCDSGGASTTYLDNFVLTQNEP